MHAIIIVNYKIFIHERSMFISKDIFYKNQHIIYLCACAINYFYKKKKKIKNIEKRKKKNGILPQNITLKAVSIIVHITYTYKYDLFYIKKYNKYSIFY